MLRHRFPSRRRFDNFDHRRRQRARTWTCFIATCAASGLRACRSAHWTWTLRFSSACELRFRLTLRLRRSAFPRGLRLAQEFVNFCLQLIFDRLRLARLRRRTQRPPLRRHLRLHLTRKMANYPHEHADNNRQQLQEVFPTGG